MRIYFINQPLWREATIRATTHYSIAVTLVNQKSDFDAAIVHFNAALRYNPNLAPARQGLALMLIKKGRLAEAVEQGLLALQRAPGLLGAQIAVSDGLLGLGRFDEAEPHIAAALQLQPNSADAHYAAALFLIHQGKTDDAILHLQEAMKLDPTSGKYRTKLSELENPRAQP